VAIEFGERIRRIPSYPLAAGYDLGDDVAMLASNESWVVPGDDVVAAAQTALSGVHRYPDPSYAALRGALSERYGIPRQRIALGNGSCDILLAPGSSSASPPPRGRGRSRSRSMQTTATTSTRSRPR
jgi:histidinol-phosphate aminotransferase